MMPLAANRLFEIAITKHLGPTRRYKAKTGVAPPVTTTADPNIVGSFSAWSPLDLNKG
jgi:hypothetical protein